MPHEYYAVMWNVKKGTEDDVVKLFESYGRPDHEIKDDDGNPVGLLLSTQVFMKDNTIVRVIEADAPSFIDVAKHMRKQKPIQELEEQLDPYLEEPRDMSTPQGAAEFFMKTAMRCLVARRHDE
jgi:hypothetical protein